MSFNGTYSIKIQAKSQVTMPSKLRDEMSGVENSQSRSFYLFSEDFLSPQNTPNTSKSHRMFMYPMQVWNDVVQKMNERIRATNPKGASQQIKAMRASVEKVVLDPHFRFTLNKDLLDKTGVEGKEIYFVGMGPWIEIWQKAAFDDYISDVAPLVQDTFKNLMDDM